MRRSGVSPRIAERLDASAFLADHVDDPRVEHDSRSSMVTTRIRLVEQALELWALAATPETLRRFGKTLRTPRPIKCRDRGPDETIGCR